MTWIENTPDLFDVNTSTLRPQGDIVMNKDPAKNLETKQKLPDISQIHSGKHINHNEKRQDKKLRKDNKKEASQIVTPVPAKQVPLR